MLLLLLMILLLIRNNTQFVVVCWLYFDRYALYIFICFYMIWMLLLFKFRSLLIAWGYLSATTPRYDMRYGDRWLAIRFHAAALCFQIRERHCLARTHNVLHCFMNEWTNIYIYDRNDMCIYVYIVQAKGEWGEVCMCISHMCV